MKFVGRHLTFYLQHTWKTKEKQDNTLNYRFTPTMEPNFVFFHGSLGGRYWALEVPALPPAVGVGAGDSANEIGEGEIIGAATSVGCLALAVLITSLMLCGL